jgi:hypothetical protein
MQGTYMTIIANNNTETSNAVKLERFKTARTLATESRRMLILLQTWLEASDKRKETSLAMVATIGARTFTKAGNKRAIVANTVGDLRTYVENLRSDAKRMTEKVNEQDMLTFAQGTSVQTYLKRAIVACDTFVAEYKEAKEAKSNADLKREEATKATAKAA